MTEQYVQQQIIAEFGTKPYYWTSKSGQAEVDFMVEYESGIIPIEAKAEKNLQAKSLKLFCSKHRPKVAVRTSMSHYFRQDIAFANTKGATAEKYTLIDLPLYAISQFMNEVNA